MATWGGDPYFRDWTDEEKKNLFDITTLLVGLGADVNSAGEHGWTALRGAAYKGVDAVVRFLVERGAKTEVFDEYGQTPLSIANAVITLEQGRLLSKLTRRPQEHVRSALELGAGLAEWASDTRSLHNSSAWAAGDEAHKTVLPHLRLA